MASRHTNRTTTGKQQLDVLVVGAGPTGLTLTAQLQAVGATCRIVDRQLDRAHESRALAVQPRTLEILRGLGVAQELVARGNDAVRVELHAGGRVVPVRLFGLGLDDTSFPFLLFVSQAETEAVLNDHLAARGVPVERGVELVAFQADQNGVTCTLRCADGQTEQARARYLVGCDGAGIPFVGGAYPQTFTLADLEVDGGLDRNTAYAFIGAVGILFFFPLGRPASWRLLGMHPTLGGSRGAPERPTLAELQALSDAFSGRGLRLRDPAWLTYFRLQHRHATRYWAGRVFLAGDAAHVHSPAGAQGMNTGIQEAWNLGWKLALVTRGLAEEALLDSYDTERRPVGRLVVRFTDRAFTVATSTKPLVRAPHAGAHAGAAADAALRQGSGVPLPDGLPAWHRLPAQPGGPGRPAGPAARTQDRRPAADARIAQDGQLSWLGEALAAPGFHLLLCSPPGNWDTDQLTSVRSRYADILTIHHLTRAAAPGALHDVDGQAFARLGVDDTAHHLIRPDGHLGYRAGRYLARWLPNPTPHPS